MLRTRVDGWVQFPSEAHDRLRGYRNSSDTRTRYCPIQHSWMFVGTNPGSTLFSIKLARISTEQESNNWVIIYYFFYRLSTKSEFRGRLGGSVTEMLGSGGRRCVGLAKTPAKESTWLAQSWPESGSKIDDSYRIRLKKTNIIRQISNNQHLDKKNDQNRQKDSDEKTRTIKSVTSSKRHFHILDGLKSEIGDA